MSIPNGRIPPGFRYWNLVIRWIWTLRFGISATLRRRGWLNILHDGSVELRNVSRVKIADAPDKGILPLGSAD